MNQEVEDIIRNEYQSLCGKLGISPVKLDIYLGDIDSKGLSPLGNALNNLDARYSAKKSIIVIPFASVSQAPQCQPAFPPQCYDKWSPGNDWAVWRIDLWHEVVHQVAHGLGCHDPEEPGRTRPDGSTSNLGHGQCFYRALCSMAGKFDVDAAVLDELLDQ